MNNQETITNILEYFPDGSIEQVRYGFFGKSDEKILEILREMEKKENAKIKIYQIHLFFAKVLREFGYEGMMDAFHEYGKEFPTAFSCNYLTFEDFIDIIHAGEYLDMVRDLRRDEIVMVSTEASSKKSANAKNQVLKKLRKQLPEVRE